MDDYRFDVFIPREQRLALHPKRYAGDEPRFFAAKLQYPRGRAAP